MLPGPRPRPVFISPTIRRELQRIVRTRTAPYREVQRAQIALMAASGYRNAEIARRVGCDVDTVRLWRERFAERPVLASLADSERSGRPPRVSAETRLEVLKLACSSPPEALARTHWTTSAIRVALKAATGVSLSDSEIGRILRNDDLRPHRFRLWLHSPDAEFGPKVRRICRLYLRPPRGATILCVDEKTQMQAVQRRFPGRLPGAGADGRFEFEYRRRGVLALIAALDVRTGRVFGQVRAQRKAVDVVAFMEALAKRYPKGPVYIIWDNLDIHRDGKDRRWTEFNARHGGRFRFVFTPKHASWINQIEIWFSLLQRRVLRYGDFRDRLALRRAVETFLHRWNRDEAHPFCGFQKF